MVPIGKLQSFWDAQGRLRLGTQSPKPAGVHARFARPTDVSGRVSGPLRAPSPAYRTHPASPGFMREFMLEQALECASTRAVRCNAPPPSLTTWIHPISLSQHVPCAPRFVALFRSCSIHACSSPKPFLWPTYRARPCFRVSPLRAHGQNCP